MVRSPLQKRIASALLLTTIAVQLNASGAWSALQAIPAFAPIIGVQQADAQSNGNFYVENADPKYGKTWIVVITCRNAAGQNVTYNQGGNSHTLAALVRNAIVAKGLNLTQPQQAIVRADGGTGAGFNWNDNSGTIHMPTVTAVCQILGSLSDTYVSSTCRDDERSGIYPNGKCNFHSPGDNNMHRFTGTLSAPAACADGVDNDGDGLKDFPQDPGCVNAQDNDEFNAAQCADGIDNDGDGAVDLADFSCSGTNDNDETNPKAACQDGVDNDGDGLTDFPQDPGCTSKQDNDEFNSPLNSSNCVGNISAPDSVPAGQQFQATITTQNNGSTTWTSPLYKLGSQNPLDNLRWGVNRVDMAQSSVPFGGSATFTSTFTAPTAPGSYSFDWDMVQTNLDHFGTICRKTITVTQPQCTATRVVTNFEGRQGPWEDVAPNGDATPPTLVGAVQAGGTVKVVSANGTYSARIYAGQDQLPLTCDQGTLSFTNNANQTISSVKLFAATNGVTVPNGATRAYVSHDEPGSYNYFDNSGNRDRRSPCVVTFDLTPNSCQLAQCADGIDNDGDGLVDFPQDPGCSNAQDNDESPRNIGNLDVEKVLNGAIAPGQNATYTITVRNTGNVAAQNVNVYDYFLDSQDLKYVPFTFVSSTGVTCSYQSGAQQVSCPIGTVQPNQTVTIGLTFAVPVNQACSQQIHNRVDAWINGQQSGADIDDVTSSVQCPSQCSDGVDNDGDGVVDMNDFSCGNPTDNDETNPKAACQDGVDNDNDGLVDFPQDPGCVNNQDNDEFNAPTTVDLSLSKTGPASVVRGQTIGYTLTVQNSSQVQATNVVVTDPIPAGLTYNDNLSYASCSQQGSNIVCPLGTINANQSGTFTITFNVPTVANCTAPVNVVNTATISATQTDSNQSNNTGSTQLNPTRVDCPQPTAQCADGIDNDGDGKVDFPQDPGCVNAQDNDEYNQPQCTANTITSTFQGNQGPWDDNPAYGDAKPPSYLGAVQAGTNFKFVSAPGYFSARLHNGNDEIPLPCSYGVVIFTNDALQTISKQMLINFPASGFVAPAGATKAWLSFDESNPGEYYDNSGNRDSRPACVVTLSVTPVTCAASQCSDGLDNDGDGAVDLNDFSCSNGSDNDETNPKAACQDGIDNDGDGLKDFPQDPGCTSKQDNDEFNQVQCPNGQVPATFAFTQPQQLVDYLNSLPDSLMPEKTTSFSGANPRPDAQTMDKICDLKGYEDVISSYSEPAHSCGDNTLVYWNGSQFVFTRNNSCALGSQHLHRLTCGTPKQVCTSQCSDGLDNDGDGAVDMADFSCSSPTDNDETNPKAACQDGIDNDGDGLTDFPLDPGCASKQDNDEFNQAQTVDLSIQKTGPASVVRGQTINYTITVGNAGSVQATNVVVTDAVPAGLAYNDALSYGPCSLSNNQVTCAIGTLAASQFGSFIIAFDTPAQQNCSVANVVNTATISAAQQDSNQGNNTASTQGSPTRVDCPSVAQCSDGIDNDGDGKIDFPQDPGCTGGQDNDESEPLQCPNKVQNGDFENPTIVNPKTNNLWQVYGGASHPDHFDPQPSIPGWEPEFYQVELQRTGLFGIAVSGQQYAEVDAQDETKLRQNVPTTPGENYKLRFWYAARPNAGTQRMAVYWNGQQIATIQETTPQSGIQWILKEYAVTGGNGATTQLGFRSLLGNGAGNLIDQVTVSSIEPNCTPTKPQCSDGIDNDLDGVVDMNDFSCGNPNDNDETNPKAACQDGVDNDNDGLTDFPFDPGCANNQDNDEFNQAQTVDLSIQKTGPASVVRGQPVFYTLTVGNAGSVQATNVVVTDVAPAGLVYNDALSYGPCQAVAGTVTCPIGTLAASQFGSFIIAFDTPAQQNCSVANVVNTATIAGTQQDSNQSNNTASTQGSPTRVDCPSVPQCNDGIDNDLDGVADMNDFSCSNPTDTDETNPKAACQDGVDNDGDGLTDFPFDPGCTSNQDNDETNVAQTVDLSIQKTGPASVVRGQPVFYTLTVGNAGQIAATNVVVTDAVPAGLVYNDALSYGPCSLSGNQVTCAIAQLAPSQFGSFIIAFDTPAQQNCSVANVVNSATISATQQDSNQGNNTSSTQGSPTRVDCPVQNQCSDGIDNDGDGAVDLADFSCSGPNDTDETNPKSQCQDGVDNDGDGLVDFPADQGCASLQDNDEFNAPVTQCNDGVDNDGDGRIDTNDAGCNGPTDTNEGDGSADIGVNLSGPATVQGGSTATYVATISNNGPDAATSPFSIRVNVPTGLSFNAGLSSQGCVQQGSFVTCSGITLGLFQQTTRTVAFNVPGNGQQAAASFNLFNAALGIETAHAQAVGVCNTTLQVTATVQGVQPDPNQNNNQSTVSTLVSCPAVAQCQDGLDNDLDGKVDYPADPGCSSPTDNNEADDPTPYGCIEIMKETFDPHGTPLPIAAQFTFVLDATRVAYNDAAGRARFNQVLAGTHSVAEIIPSGWTQLSVAPAGGTVTVTAGTTCAKVTFRNRQVFVPNAQCADGYDNDGDGATDYPADPGCSSATDNDEYNNSFTPQCSDGIDNDGDGLKDYPQDTGCDNAADNNEQNGVAPVVYACNDNLDNDGDGLKDFPADPGCSSATDTDEANAVQGTYACNDNVDNDGDGLKDYPADPGCSSATDTDEFNFRAPRCSDGIDNDGDGLKDYPQDTGCTTAYDDNEYNDRLWLDRWKEFWNWNW